jgi:hypothetical protein
MGVDGTKSPFDRDVLPKDRVPYFGLKLMPTYRIGLQIDVIISNSYC